MGLRFFKKPRPVHHRRDRQAHGIERLKRFRASHWIGPRPGVFWVLVRCHSISLGAAASVGCKRAGRERSAPGPSDLCQ